MKTEEHSRSGSQQYQNSAGLKFQQMLTVDQTPGEPLAHELPVNI